MPAAQPKPYCPSWLLGRLDGRYTWPAHSRTRVLQRVRGGPRQGQERLGWQSPKTFELGAGEGKSYGGQGLTGPIDTGQGVRVVGTARSRPKPSWKQLCCSAQDGGREDPQRGLDGEGKEVIREAGRSPGSGQEEQPPAALGEVRQPLPVSQGLFYFSPNPSPRLGPSKEGPAGIRWNLARCFSLLESGGRG